MTSNDDLKISRLKKELAQANEKIKSLTPGKWGLFWHDKPQNVIEDWDQHYPTLTELTKKELKDKTNFFQKNILIQGDNYNALSILNYTHPQSIDMIYIDPPYNTGGSLMYNNNYVRKDDENKHAYFLSILYHRLKITKFLLKKNGVICCTIDDAELISILALFEKLGAKVIRIVTIQNKKEGRGQSGAIVESHEYAIFATWGSIEKIESRRILRRDRDTAGGNEKMTETAKDGRKFRYDDFHRRGDYKTNFKNGQSRYYPIYVHPKTLKISPTPKKNYQKVFPPLHKDDPTKSLIWNALPSDFYKEITNKDPTDGSIIDPDRDMSEEKYRAFKDDSSNNIVIKFRQYGKTFTKASSVWVGPDYNAQSHGSKLIPKIIKQKFDFPKSIYAVFDCLDLFLPENGTILDFFAGSGTTGHSIALLNARDWDLNNAFKKKYGKDWHLNSNFLSSDAILYAHFEPTRKVGTKQKLLPPKELSKKWLEWRNNAAQRRFILCTNNEIPEKQLQKMRPNSRKKWEQLSKKEQKKEVESSHGICQKITYPRLSVLSAKGFKHSKDEVKRYLTPLSSEGHIAEWLDQKRIKDYCPPFHFPMKFYKINNTISSNISKDNNKSLLVKNAIETYCLKEDCFEKYKEVKGKFLIFKNSSLDKYFGIVLNDKGITPFTKDFKKIKIQSKKLMRVYVLTLSDSSRQAEFDKRLGRGKVVSVSSPSDINAAYSNVIKQARNVL